MIRNNLPQVLNKKTAAQNMSTLFCFFIKELGQIVKNYHDNYFLMLAKKNVFLWWHLEISLVLLFSKVSKSAQMMETFSNKHRLQHFEPQWYGEAFLWISHDRLSSRPWSFKVPHISVSQYHSCICDIWKILYGCYTMFWTPLQKLYSKQSSC